MFCKTCQSDKIILTPGKYSQALECSHIAIGVPVSEIIKQKNDEGNKPTATEAAQISTKTNRIENLPEVDSEGLVNRALTTMVQSYEEFFVTESILIEDIIKEQGKDKAVLTLTAIHWHLSKVLFTLNRFRNVYYARIEQLRKEIEDKTVRELITNHDYYYTSPEKKPVKPRNPKLSTETDKLKQNLAVLTDNKGNAIDVTAIYGKLMWGQSKKELEEKEKKEDYKAGLDKIADSITKKSDNK